MLCVNRFWFCDLTREEEKVVQIKGDEFIRIANLRKIWYDLLLKRKRNAETSVVNEPIAPTGVPFRRSGMIAAYTMAGTTQSSDHVARMGGMTP
jgi:hypothetical protein